MRLRSVWSPVWLWPHLRAASIVLLLLIFATATRASADPLADWRALSEQVVQTYRHGDAAAAVSLAEQALSLARKAFGPLAPNTLTSMNNLAELYEAQSRYGEAEPLLRETLQLRREVLGPKHRDTLLSMNKLAELYEAQGRYGEAESLLRETLQLRREALGPKHPDTLASMNNLAELYEAQGRFGEAEPLLREALEGFREVLGPAHPQTLASMNNLAALYNHQGRYGEAEPLLRGALQLDREVLGPTHPDTLGGMNNLAFSYARQGRYGDAEPLLREALQLDRAVLGPAHPQTLATQLNLVGMLAALGQIAAAAALQAQMEPQVLSWLGVELYSPEAATARRQLVASQSTYQDVALNLAVAPGADATAAQLAASALLRFKNLAADEAAFLAHLSRASPDPEIRAAADRVRALHQQRARLFQAGGSAAEVAQTARDLDDAELELGRLNPIYPPQLLVRTASLSDLQASLGGLPVRSALLDLRQFSPVDFRTQAWSAPHWAGVLIGGDGSVRVRDLGAVGDSGPAVAALLADPQGKAGKEGSTALYRQLIAPFAVDLSGIERLYVAPDGMLNLVSFGLLQDKSGPPLMARMDVRLLQSGRDLLLQPAVQPAHGLVAVGGIDFDRSGPATATATATATTPSVRLPSPAEPGAPQLIAAPGPDQTQLAGLERLRVAMAEDLSSGFAPLPHAGEEVAAVADLYRQARPHETISVVPGKHGPQPTKSWLLALSPPRVLHLATHGFYWPEKVVASRPRLLAGIALAGANQMLRDGGQEGILFALEAQDLNLQGTELVVLSACDTAPGRYDYGGGLAGLVRALRTAGARYVLVALRPVEDQSAATFLQRFYHYWLSQTGPSDPAAALRATQREYLSATPANAADQAWASFILVGG